jgi:hypothetical protein
MNGLLQNVPILCSLCAHSDLCELAPLELPYLVSYVFKL